MAAPKPADLPSRSKIADRTPQRGQIWQVAADPEQPPVGTELWSNRPALIVSNNVLGAKAGFVLVVYLTTSTNKRTGPAHVPLGRALGDAETMALVEQIHTVDLSRLVRRLGSVSRSMIEQVDAALSFTLSLGKNPSTFSLYRKWEQQLNAHEVDLAAEITALTGAVENDRIAALRRATALLMEQRDAYRTLAESSAELTDLQRVLEQDPSAAPAA